MSGFEFIAVAADDYPDPPGALEASAVARRLAAVLGSGGDLVDPPDIEVVTDKAELERTLRAWSRADRARSSVVYVVGHGEGDGLTHRLLVPDPEEGTVDLPTGDLVRYLQDEWLIRQSDPEAWTLFILDCCQSDLGVGNLAHELEAHQFRKPRRLALWPVNVEGAATLGTFVGAFERAVERGFTENDESIRLDEVFRLARPELGEVEKRYDLPDGAVLTNPRRAPSPIMVNVDAHAELRAVIGHRDAAFRAHFLTKAQGAETGELALYFAGREAEIDRLCRWLNDTEPGKRVVTGDAGSGKSALLGHLAVLADPELVDAYVDSGLAPHLADGPRPPAAVFDVLIHLTGKTLHDTLVVVRDSTAMYTPEYVDLDDPWTDERRVLALIDQIWPAGGDGPPLTILADGLDEAQEPEAVAGFLGRLGDGGRHVRVLVGTRRSTGEGPDQPADPTRRGLLDALGATDADTLVLGPDPDASRTYAFRRLRAAGYGEFEALQLALGIAERNEPFLFARLAVSEIKAASAPEVPSDEALDRLLSGGHRGIFAAAVDRIRERDVAAATALEVLALARGRGMPRDRGVWSTAAAVLGHDRGLPVGEADIDRTLEVAAPYITLDAEAGTSTYRLAHQTFVEFFRAQTGQSTIHGALAAALIGANEGDDRPWQAANHYEVRYAVEHLTVAVEHSRWDEPVSAFLQSGGWLARAVTLLPIETLVELLTTAHDRIAVAGGDPTDLARLDTVARALLRSRTALARHPAQVGPLLHARLHPEPDPVLADLGRHIADLGGEPWLEMVDGRLPWVNELETRYTDAATIRSLAAGVVGGDPLVAIGIDHRIDLWDPRTARPDPGRRIDLGDRRATALALAELGGGPVIAMVASYDGVAQVVDLDGVPLGPELPLDLDGYADAVAIGRVGGRPALAVRGATGEVRAWWLDDGASVPLGDDFPVGTARGVDELDGGLVATCVVGDEAGRRVEVVSVPDGTVLTSRPVSDLLANAIELTTVGRFDDGLRCFAVVADHTRLWDPADPDPLDWDSPVSDEPRQRIRSVALGRVEGRAIVVASPDLDGTGVVEVREATAAAGNEPGAPLAVGVGYWGSVDESMPAPRYDIRAYSIDRMDLWPRTSYQEATVDGVRQAVTGSIDASAVVWDLSGPEARVVAGPFRRLDADDLDRGPMWFHAKGGPASAADAALGEVPGVGACVAIASDGGVRLHRVATGEPVPLPDIDVGSVQAVALGTLSGRPVLVTGSVGGIVGVVALDEGRVVTRLGLDDAISRLAIDPDRDRLLAQTASGQGFGLVLRAGPGR